MVRNAAVTTIRGVGTNVPATLMVVALNAAVIPIMGAVLIADVIPTGVV